MLRNPVAATPKALFYNQLQHLPWGHKPCDNVELSQRNLIYVFLEGLTDGEAQVRGTPRNNRCKSDRILRSLR